MAIELFRCLSTYRIRKGIKVRSPMTSFLSHLNYIFPWYSEIPDVQMFLFSFGAQHCFSILGIPHLCLHINIQILLYDFSTLRGQFWVQDFNLLVLP